MGQWLEAQHCSKCRNGSETSASGNRQLSQLRITHGRFIVLVGLGDSDEDDDGHESSDSKCGQAQGQVRPIV